MFAFLRDAVLFPVLKTKLTAGPDSLGAAVLVFKGNREGFSIAKAMDAHFKGIRQGRSDWERVLLKSGLPISSGNVEKELSAWLQHVQGLVEKDGNRRLFCYLATKEYDLRDRGLYRQ